MQGYHEDVKTNGKNHQVTILEMKEQLEKLSTSISTERDSLKQVRDLETKNTENQTKLDVAEVALEQERQKFTAMVEKASALSSQISSLESEAALCVSNHRSQRLIQLDSPRLPRTLRLSRKTLIQ